MCWSGWGFGTFPSCGVRRILPGRAVSCRTRVARSSMASMDWADSVLCPSAPPRISYPRIPLPPWTVRIARSPRIADVSSATVPYGRSAYRRWKTAGNCFPSADIRFMTSTPILRLTIFPFPLPLMATSTPMAQPAMPTSTMMATYRKASDSSSTRSAGSAGTSPWWRPAR